MTIADKLLEDLITIRDKGRLVSVGICGNVKLLMDDQDFEQADEVMDDLILEWKQPHDNPVYPIGGADVYYREKEQLRLWENPRRWELLHFMIAKLEAA